MNRDDIALLRQADPVSRDVAYADHEVGRRVADIVNSERVLVTRTPDSGTRRHGRVRGRLVPILAAAVVLVVAGVAAVLAGGGDGSHRSAAPGARQVICAVSTAGGDQATHDREARAAQVISTRLSSVGGSASAFAYDAGGGTVGFTPHGVSPAAAVQACHASSTSIRPVVTRPVDVDTSAPRSSDPLASLTFAVPTDEAAYARLTRLQQAQLAAAMAHFDCSAGTATLTCSPAAGPTQVYLLGRLIAGNADIAAADALGPSMHSVQWVVLLKLHPKAASRLHDYSSRHHTTDAAADLSQCGPADAQPCADFLALTNDGVVIYAPAINATLSGGRIKAAPDLTEMSAHALAADYAAAAIQLRPL